MLSTDLRNVGRSTECQHPHRLFLTFFFCNMTFIYISVFVLLSSATIGISHPDIVVETNTLSSVPPPDITYTLSIPESTINCGFLSALQLEAIIYACQVNTQFALIFHADSVNESCFGSIGAFCSCVCSSCAPSNTRWSSRTTREQASWSEMGQGSERVALWQESSWRITLREERKHCGKRDLLLWLT